MRVLSTLAIRAGLLVVTLPKCAKWLIGDYFLFRSEMCESRSPQGERGRGVCRKHFESITTQLHHAVASAPRGAAAGGASLVIGRRAAAQPLTSGQPPSLSGRKASAAGMVARTL